MVIVVIVIVIVTVTVIVGYGLLIRTFLYDSVMLNIMITDPEQLLLSCHASDPFACCTGAVPIFPLVLCFLPRFLPAFLFFLRRRRCFNEPSTHCDTHD